MILLFWIFVVYSIGCFRLSLSAPAGTFSYTYFATVPIPTSGTVQTSVPPGTVQTSVPNPLFKNATKLVIDTTSAPYGGSGGVYYIADSGNHVIKRVPISTGIPVIVAGTPGVSGYFGDNDLATLAKLNNPMDVTFDQAGNLYIADTNNHVIRTVSYSPGIITTIMGTGIAGSSLTGSTTSAALNQQLNSPMGIYSTPDAIIYIADTNNHVIRRYKVGTPPVFTAALWGTNGGSGTTGDNDKAGSSSVKFNKPTCITRAPDLSFWICDTQSRVRRIQFTGGYITTVAGSVTTGFSEVDGAAASSALLNNPMQVSCVGASLSLCYIADTNNHRIRLVQDYIYAIAPTQAPTQVPSAYPTQFFAISTVVGSETRGYSNGNGTSLFVSFHYHVHVDVHITICMHST